MTTRDIEIGGIYTAKVSGKVVQVRVIRKGERFCGKVMRDFWECLSLATRRTIIVRSPQRFRDRIAAG